jgi:hypothetical protein
LVATVGDEVPLGDRHVYLALDVGTSRLKGAVVTRTGLTAHHEVLGLARRTCAAGPDGTLSHLVYEVEALIARLADVAYSAGLEVAALGVAAHMASALLLDESYAPLGDLMMAVDETPGWAVEKAKSRAESVGVDLHQRTGCPLEPHYPLPKLYAWAASSPDGGRVRYVGDLKSYLLWRWTGRFVTDLGSASASQLLDQRRQGWLELPGLPWGPFAYAPLCLPWQVVGSTRPGVSAAMGFKGPVPVVAGTGDAIAASVAAGILHSSEALLTVGTTAAVRWRERGWAVLGSREFRQLVSPRLRLRGSRIVFAGQGDASAQPKAEAVACASERLARTLVEARSRLKLSSVQVSGGGAGPAWVEALERSGFVVERATCEDGTLGMAVVMEKALRHVSLGEALRTMGVRPYSAREA